MGAAELAGFGVSRLLSILSCGCRYAALLYKQRSILKSKDKMALEEQNNYPHVGHISFLVRERLSSGSAFIKVALIILPLLFFGGSAQTNAYKPDFYFFEVVDSVRRLLMASVIGIVSSDSAAAPVLGIIISAVFIYVFSLAPYKKKLNNAMGVLLSFSLAGLFLAALMIRVDATSEDENDQEVFGYLLIALVFAPQCSCCSIGLAS